jgi:hypothetical protein
VRQRRAVLRRAPVALPQGRGAIPGRGPGPVGWGAPGLRGGPGSLSRRDGGPAAPKSFGFPVPVEPCKRCSEERRLPCSARPCARCSEERRLPCPGGPGACQRGRGLRPGRDGGPILRRGPVPCLGETVRGAPKSAGCRVSVELGHPSSEEGGRPGPGWNEARGAPRSAVCQVPMAGSPATQGGDGCARKRFQCDDAPIRRSGPPRHRAHGADGCRSSRHGQVKSPRRCRCRSADAAMAIEPPPGAGSAPDDRSEALPAARRRLPGFRGRSHGVSVALRPHPPRWADVRARRNLTKQPTSRLCSADESVVTSRRCQRPVTRSFHGLCGPLQGPARSAPARRCQTRERSCTGPKPGFREPRLSSVAASRRGFEPLGSLRPFTLPAIRRSGGRDGRRGGPKPNLAAASFQRRDENPLPRPDLRLRPKPRLVSRAVLPKYVRSVRS